VTVNVTQPAPALTVKISANPTSIYPGDSATLSWSSTGATDASIEGIGNVATSGSQIVSPTKTTTYTITVSNRNEGTVAYASTTVTVNTGTSFTINITDTHPSNSISSDSSIFTVGDPFTISGGPTNVNDYSIAQITSSGGEENLGTPGVLSGSFSPNDVGLWKVWVSGTKDNPMTSNPVYFAVIKAPVQSKPKPTAPVEIDCNRSVTFAGKTTTTTIAYLTIDPAVVVPPSGVTLTLNFADKQNLLGLGLPSSWGCLVPSYDTTLNFIKNVIDYTSASPGYSKSDTEYPTSTTDYGLKCTTPDGATDVCTNIEIIKDGQVIPPPVGKIKFWIEKIFGGAAGGMQEVAPFSQ
jgi:hypothetical protein